MDHLTLPEILNIPSKLLPIITKFNDYRIFLIEGGRGGGKSHSIARFLLYLNDKYNLRTVCGRETQNSINESVHALLSDLIKKHQLNFETQQTKIHHREKTSGFTFRGFREQGRFNTQGLEGIDVLWIDEGQAITKPTIDIILPTIRKPNSKIFVTMNRHVHNDPAYVMLVNRPDCLHIKIDYLDNEHCTQELINEANICKGQSLKDYEHIWLGKPLEQSEDAVYSIADFELGKQMAHNLAQGYGMRVAGFDIARYGDDKCAAVIMQQMGALHWEEVFCDEWDHRDLNYTTGRILTITNEQRVDYAAVDEDGMGAGPFDTLSKGRGLDYFTGFRNPSISYQDNKSFGNNRTVKTYKFKDALSKGHRCIRSQSIIDEMLTIKYTFDNNQRRILISKDKMRKDGFKSPNLADALIMAESLIGTVKLNQERQYEPSMNNNYSKDDNLFNIAGIK